MAIKDSNLTIMIKDMNRSISFYQSIGFTVKNQWGEHYAQMTAPGITLGLHPSNESFSGSGNLSIGLTTENFQDTKEMLQKLSIDYTERNEDGGQFIHFKDPDGSELYFINPKW